MPFDVVAEFDFDSAQILIDNRHDYGEVRYRAIGCLRNDIAVVVFTMRGEAAREISLRLASRKERREDEEAANKVSLD